MSEDTQAGNGQAGSVATAKDTLSVTDNRTGKTYEVEITDGTVRAMDFRQMKVDDDDFGLMTYDPAFTNTASTRSAITYIDGDKGILEYRGYPIEQLAEQSTYLEVAYLLVHGELPTQAELDEWTHQITIHTFVHENVKEFMGGFRHDAHPMGMLLGSVGALSTFYPDANEIADPDNRAIQTIRLIAKMPTLAAFAYRHTMGMPYVYPDNDLPYPGNFLNMMYKMTELKYQPDERLARALDILFILHADHEQNCSTNAVRSVGSSQVDPYSAVAAGVGALYGPLHGGANEAVLRMLRRIERVENIPDFLKGVKNRDEKLMGFGHRVYKNYDPRARIIKKHVDEVLDVVGLDNPLVAIASELEKQALDDEFFTDRKLYPNVDFYSGLIYEALGIPNEMFTVIFAIPRTSGWVAQWMEMNGDSEQKIARPRQIYTGKRDLTYVPIKDREGEEKITGPPATRPIKSRRGA
jgi:citrate synthase